MSNEITDLYKALDKAIGGFETRMSRASIKAIEREKAIVEAQIVDWAEAFNAEITRLTNEIDKLRKAGPGTAPPKKPPPPPLPPTPTTRRAPLPRPRPASPSFPPLPKPLTVSVLAEYVRNLGFEVGNNRPEGGLWVFADDKAFGDLAKHIESAGVGCDYLPNGRKRRVGPQYHLDPLKRLSL